MKDNLTAATVDLMVEEISRTILLDSVHIIEDLTRFHKMSEKELVFIGIGINDENRLSTCLFWLYICRSRCLIDHKKKTGRGLEGQTCDNIKAFADI